MSASSLLAAYRHPDVAATARADFRPERFVAGGSDTLHICAPPRRQAELAPLVVAMLSHTLEAAAARTASHGPLAPTLRLLLDEAANIAPLRDLPHHLSQAAGHGVRIATIWQSLAQARERYHDGADSILANSTAKLFMGPIIDNTNRSYLYRFSRKAVKQCRSTAPGRETLGWWVNGGTLKAHSRPSGLRWVSF